MENYDIHPVVGIILLVVIILFLPVYGIVKLIDLVKKITRSI